MFLKRGRTFPLAATTHEVWRPQALAATEAAGNSGLGSLVNGPWVPLLSARGSDSDLGQVSMRGMAEKKKLPSPEFFAFSAQFCTWILR